MMTEKNSLVSYLNREKYRIIIFIAVCIGLGLLYFSFPLMLLPDSVDYYEPLRIFYGDASFATWPTYRGFSLPVTIYIITLLFGNSERGLVAGGLVLFYVYLLTISYFARKICFRTRIAKWIALLIMAVFLIFNPMIIGYMHVLLTELIAIPLAVISVFFSYRWLIAKRRTTKLALLLGQLLLCVFAWFLKQPYVFLAWAPLLISALISIFEHPHIRNILFRSASILLSVIAILSSIFLWNTFLQKSGANTDSGSTDSYLRDAIINGNTQFCIDFYTDHYNEAYIMNCGLISEADKNEIQKIFRGTSEYKSFKLIDVFYDFTSREQENIEAKLVLFSHSENFTVSDALKEYLSILLHHPKKTLRSYALNYLALADVVPSVRHRDANLYYPSLSGGMYYENKSIGYAIYEDADSNLRWLNGASQMHYLITNLITENTAPKSLRKAMINTFDTYNFIYKAAMLLLPLASIAMLIKRLRHKTKEYRDVYDLGLILLGTALIHVLFHVCMGAIIDRYAFVVFPLIIVGLFVLASSPKRSTKDTDMENEEK